ncbi:MAG: hypothetical protein Q9211_004987 [Gyalolechia sp. 1 TL-2023]
MERPPAIIPRVTGTALGRDVSFFYQREGDTYTLVLAWEGEEDRIYDREVIGVIDDLRAKSEDKLQPELILRVVTSKLSPEEPQHYFSLRSLPVTGLPLDYLNTHLLERTPDHLLVNPNQDGSRNLTVIISVRSGVGEAQQYYDEVLTHALAAIGLKRGTYHVHITTSEKSITEIAEKLLLPRANHGIAQTVLLLSGDGGIVDTVNILLLSTRNDKYVKPTIGLISMGTGNALANSTGLNRDATRGLRSIFRGAPRSLPTFTAHFSSGSVFLTDEGRSTESLPSSASGHGVVNGVVVCSWALHASLVADSDTTEYRKFGAQRFQMAAKELLAPDDGSGPHLYNGKITLYKADEKGHEYTEEVLGTKTSYIVATLVSNFEKELCISPQSKPLDGQLRVLRFGDISAADVMRLIGQAMHGGGHEKDEMVQYAPINGLRIQMDEPDGRWRRVCVDGKIVQVEEGGWVEVRRGTEEVVDLVA